MTGKSFFSAKVIAGLLGVGKRTVHRRALREGWQKRDDGYRLQYAVPRTLLPLCKSRPAAPSILCQASLIRELKRAAAVLGFVQARQRDPGRGVERALDSTVKDLRHLVAFSKGTLRHWIAGVERDGLAALGEHKAGRVGRKPARLEKMFRRLQPAPRPSKEGEI